MTLFATLDHADADLTACLARVMAAFETRRRHRA